MSCLAVCLFRLLLPFYFRNKLRSKMWSTAPRKSSSPFSKCTLTGSGQPPYISGLGEESRGIYFEEETNSPSPKRIFPCFGGLLLKLSFLVLGEWPELFLLYSRQLLSRQFKICQFKVCMATYKEKRRKGYTASPKFPIVSDF